MKEPEFDTGREWSGYDQKTKGKDKAMLLELATRCEQATGEDTALDSRIWIAVGRPSEYLVRDLKLDPPDYTVSVDAALLLVPEGFVMALTNCGTDSPHGPDWTKASAVVGRDTDKGIEPVTAATPALALCAAALRAKAAAQANR